MGSINRQVNIVLIILYSSANVIIRYFTNSDFEEMESRQNFLVLFGFIKYCNILDVLRIIYILEAHSYISIHV